MPRHQEPVTYDLYDEQGHRLGQVTLPRDAMITGTQAGTVLLRREVPALRPQWVGKANRAA